MESFVASFPHRRSHLPKLTYRSLLNHLCSSFDQEPRVSLATPAVLQDLVLKAEIAQVSSGETCEPGEVYADENPPENLSMVESRSDRGSGELRAEIMKIISQDESLILGDVTDGIDLQDATVSNRQKDIFDDLELMMNESEDFLPEICVNLFEGLDVNDYVDEGMVASLGDIAKEQPLDIVQNVEEKPDTATEVQVGTLKSDKMVSECIEKEEEVPKSVEPNGVIHSGISEKNNERLPKEMELEKSVSNTLVLTSSVSQMVEDDDVEEGEISGDDNDDMLVGDDIPDERHEESHLSQVGATSSHLTSHNSFGFSRCHGVGSLSTPEIVGKKEQKRIVEKLGIELTDVGNQAKKSDQNYNNEEKISQETSIKKRSAPSMEAKARKKARARKKRAQERIALGVKKLKLKPVAPKPKPIKYCRHYLKGRCHEGDKCKFSHDTTPETKSSPCCYFATQSCMKGDDCPYDHDLSKYPCNNFITKGFCHRGENCLFSHKGTPQSVCDTLSAYVTASSTNFAAASLSPQKTNKQSERDAIAKLPAIQPRVSSAAVFLKPSSQSNQRNSADASSPKINEHVTPPQIPPLRKPSVAPKGMSFLALDKTSQEDTVKSSSACKPNTHNSENQTLKQSQQGNFLPLVPPKETNFLSFASEEQNTLSQEPQESASRNLNTTLKSHVQSSLKAAMKLAAEFETVKFERRNNDPTKVVNKGNATITPTVTRSSGNISSKILEFLSSFSHNKN